MELRDYLFQKKITQTELAKRLDISLNHFSQIVRRVRRPSINLAIKIEALTKGAVTKEELLFENSALMENSTF